MKSNQITNQEDQILKQMGFFLLYAFSIAWVFWLIIITSNNYFNKLWFNELATWIPFTIGDLAPFISSYLVYRQFKNSFNQKSFVRFAFGKKIDAKTWLIFGLFSVWRVLMIWIGFEVGKSVTILLVISMLINLIFTILWGGLEELGWRGILQPNLEKIFGFLPATLIVGTVWSVWHLPLWLMKGTVQSQLPFALYLISGIILSFSFATFYKYTKSLFLTVLSHAWFNVCIGLALYTGSSGNLELNLNWKVYLVFAVELIISIILAVIYNRKKSANTFKTLKIE